MGCHAAVIIFVAALLAGCSTTLQHSSSSTNIQLGPRPFFLVEEMANSELKTQLKSCANGPFKKSNFSIAHRGAPMMFPEHTKESYEAAALMGAGVIECDVTFTKDKELVCRHAQNDLHTTTNILATPLAAKCTKPFTPFNAINNTPASAECRTSDITLAEFKTLRGKMDASNPRALTVAEYLGGTATWRTELYSGPSSGTLMTLKESIALFQRLGVKMTPELKSASVPMPYHGFSQADYAQKMIDEHKAANVVPSDVFPQSFNKDDVLHWIKNEPLFGQQAVFLDSAVSAATLPNLETLKSYRADGIQIVAPPLFALLELKDGRIAPSSYAQNAKAVGLKIITWTLERSGRLADRRSGFYYQTVASAISREGDVMQVLDVLAKEVGVLGVFSDWPATVTYYANCVGLK
jgi:glycerophosphoryl diester phosphodiesterase